MANPKEGYLIVTHLTFDLVSHLYPHAIEVGMDHRLISYSLSEEVSVLSLFGTKEIVELDAVSTVRSMHNLSADGYVCYASTIHEVINEFNSPTLK